MKSTYRLLPILSLIGFLSTTNYSCKKEEVPSRCDLDPCDPGRKTLKKASNRIGFVYFNHQELKFEIHSEVDGGYDSQDIGVVCDLPGQFQKSGLKVQFNGEYKEFCKVPTMKIPGGTYYYLHLSAIKEKIN